VRYAITTPHKETKTLKTILVDAASILFPIALTKNGLDLCTSTGVQTTFTYSFLSELLSIGCLCSSNKFIIAFDSNKNFRKDVYAGYKAKRRKSEPEIMERFNKMFSEYPQLRSVLNSIGIPCIELSGYEADDIIASLVYNNTSEEFVIVSSDHDMYQLLSDRVSIFKVHRYEFFTTEDFDKKYPGLTPSDYWKLLSISGCRTDEVPSVTGDRTAYKYLTNQLKPESKAYQAIINGKDTIAFAEKLVKLPYAGTPALTLPEIKLNKVEFFNICQELEFRYFLEKEFVTWCGFFSMRGA
jgi:DNA polymerase-1